MNKQSEQAIEDYLDLLSAQLLSLPPQLQSETREELRQHLHSLVAMQREPQRILESALRQFGDPVEIGRKLALEWEEDQWSLRGLTLLQRFDKIRESGALEIEAAQPNRLLMTLNYVQVVFLLLATQVLPAGLHLSSVLAHVVHFGGLGFYFVIGLAACFLEWKQGAQRASSGAPDHKRTWSNIIARAGMAVLIPSVFLLPDQTPLIAGAMVLLGVVPVILTRSTPRTRLLLKASAVYGLAMGLVLGVITPRLTGSQTWLWWLLLPILYSFGCWFWKRPLLWTKK